MDEPYSSAPASATAGEATRLLEQLVEGSSGAETRLFELLQTELRRMAHAQMRGQGAGHTLQTTALVNEAWLRLVAGHRPGGRTYHDREHFLAVAARAMRQILIDHARRRARPKHGGDRRRVPLDEVLDAYESSGHDLVAIDDALLELARHEERQARIVELRFFAGLTLAETARALGISTATVEREWRLARLWLMHRLDAV